MRKSANHSLILLICLSLLITACATPTTEPPPSAPPATSPPDAGVTSAPPPAETGTHPPFDAGQLTAASGDLFAGAGTCTACHQRITDGAGNDVSMPRLWMPSMMANAARDPYWQAEVRREVMETPALQDVIEDTCATCHMPMARTTLAAQDETAAILDDGLLDSDHPLHELAMDGVSCTVCHQIEPDNFGEDGSYSGGYTINLDLPAGERLNYGPFPMPEQSVTVMQSAVGFVPTRGEHIQQSEHCATCHTLYTPTVDANGEVAGLFPEQVPYLEWLNSDFADEQSCQECHMPAAEAPAMLSLTGGEPRQPVRLHTFTGGSSSMLGVLRASGADLDLAAGSQHFDAALSRMQDQLASRTATLTIANGSLSDGTLSADINISTLVGHKLPTAFPSRRVWLQIRVEDADGSPVFTSGIPAADGSIPGNANDEDPTAYEPHHDTITAPDQVQIYETILTDTEGHVTTTLLHASSYVKDNRLLPAGFDPATDNPDIAVYGAAAADDDFRAGADTVTLSIDVGDAPGPYTITVALVYQSISFRWADNLHKYSDGAEVAAFLNMFADFSNKPTPVASSAAVIQSDP